MIDTSDSGRAHYIHHIFPTEEEAMEATWDDLSDLIYRSPGDSILIRTKPTVESEYNYETGETLYCGYCRVYFLKELDSQSWTYGG